MQSCHNLPSGSSNTASQPSPLVRQPPSAEIESSDSDNSGDESGNDSCSSSDLEMEVNKLMVTFLVTLDWMNKVKQTSIWIFNQK